MLAFLLHGPLGNGEGGKQEAVEVLVLHIVVADFTGVTLISRFFVGPSTPSLPSFFLGHCPPVLGPIAASTVAALGGISLTLL